MRIIGVAAVAALVIGCGGDATSPPRVIGTYNLQTVRQDPLPAVLSQTGNYALKVTAGTITLDGDLTFHDSYSFWEYNGGTITTTTRNCSGTWSPTSERTFTLREIRTLTCDEFGVGEWDGRNRLTIAWEYMGTAMHTR